MKSNVDKLLKKNARLNQLDGVHEGRADSSKLTRLFPRLGPR